MFYIFIYVVTTIVTSFIAVETVVASFAFDTTISAHYTANRSIKYPDGGEVRHKR